MFALRLFVLFTAATARRWRRMNIHVSLNLTVLLNVQRQGEVCRRWLALSAYNKSSIHIHVPEPIKLNSDTVEEIDPIPNSIPENTCTQLIQLQVHEKVHLDASASAKVQI